MDWDWIRAGAGGEMWGGGAMTAVVGESDEVVGELLVGGGTSFVISVV